jgi:sulfite exporter TauE/SafE
MLLFATFAGTALQGAAVMALFGLGTLPAMLSSGLLAGQLQRITRGVGFGKASGAVLLIFGILTTLAPFTSLHR